MARPPSNGGLFRLGQSQTSLELWRCESERYSSPGMVPIGIPNNDQELIDLVPRYDSPLTVINL